MSNGTQLLQVKGIDGRTFNVVLVQKGERYGREDCLVHDRNDPLVEFWDDSADRKKFPPRGQFVSRYYLHTLLERPKRIGIDLLGYVAGWKIDASEMDKVRDALDAWCMAKGPITSEETKEAQDYGAPPRSIGLGGYTHRRSEAKR